MKAGLLPQRKNTNRRRTKRLGMLALGSLGFVLLFPAIVGVRLNDSPSLPIGLYVVTSDPSADLVRVLPSGTICFPYRRAWLPQ